jgi:hypothetical protein
MPRARPRAPHESAHPARRRAAAAEHANTTLAPSKPAGEPALSQHDQRRMALLYAVIPVLIWLVVHTLLQLYCLAVFAHPESAKLAEQQHDKLAGKEHEHGHDRLVRCAQRRNVWVRYYLLRCLLLTLLTASS